MRGATVAALAALTLGTAAALVAIVVARGRDAGPDAATPPLAATTAVPTRGTRADAPWGEIAGRVSDLEGRAVAGALVVAQDLHGFGGLARSGADGTYRIELMPCARVRPRWPDRGWPSARVPHGEAEVVVAASADGFTRSNTRRVVARRGETTDVGPLALYRGGRIEGRVVDPSGREVPARVRVVSVQSRDTVEGMQALPAAHPAEFVDAPVGRGFALGPVGPGAAELWATAPGIGTAHGRVEVAEGATVRVDLPVRVELHIAGRVVDGAGAPVAACRVVCRPDPARTEGPVPRVRVMKPLPGTSPEDAAPDEGGLAGRPLATDTDADGQFWFYGLRDGAAHTVVVADAPADAGSRAAATGVLPGRGDLVLVAPSRSDVVGSVTDASSGRAVAGAGLRLLPRAQAAFLRLTRPLGLADAGRTGPASGADGSFRLPGVFAGEHVLYVTRAGFEVAEMPVTVASSAAAGAAATAATANVRVDVRLVPAARLEGVVTTPDGRPAAGANLVVVPAPVASLRPSGGAGPWSGRLFATADAAGAFVLDGLPADTDLVLRASDRDGRSSRAPVRLGRSERRREEVRLRDPATIAVRVRPATAGAVAGHPVRLRGLDDPDVEVAVETDADGVARVTHLPPGRYEVLATDPAEDAARPDVAARVATIDLASGVETAHAVAVADVTIVRGAVVVDGVPVRAARIGFGPLAGTPDHFRPLLFEARDGVYSGRVPPGSYHVHVAFPGFRREIAEPVVVPAVPEHVLDWDLRSK